MFKKYSLQFSMGLIVFTFVIALGISISGLISDSQIMDKMANTNIEILSTAKDIQFDELTLTDAVRGIIIDPSNQELTRYNLYADKIDSDIKRMQELDPSSKVDFDKIDGLNKQMVVLEDQMMTSHDEAVNIYKGQYSTLRQQLQTIMNEFIDREKKIIAQEGKDDIARSVILRNVAISIGSIAILISIIIAWFLLRSIISPVRAIAAEATKIADGDLTAKEIEVKAKNEIGELAAAFNRMTQNLRDLVKQVYELSEQVAASAEELNASAEQNTQAANQISVAITGVSSGAENQSSAIEETSAAIQKMSASIEQMAATASTVAQQTERTFSVTQEGQKAVDNAVKQMGAVAKGTSDVRESIGKLAGSSKQIGEITNVISDIAGQTNLLALNAAIEAARAGEQGRGFAVVAEEVRKLAEQSAEAATKIAGLIKENQTNIHDAVRSMEVGANDVEHGIEVVDKAGMAFAEIARSVEQVSTQVQEITATTLQMANSSQQVVTKVREIENISRSNLSETQTVLVATEEQTASVEQIAAASQTLTTMAQELQNTLNKFRF
ncbi:methyl-accepting chemotaxis protein [Desulfosporosinus metallidurans]|uniref:Methyl-accepting chemotaxis protein I (Serine chemoreceptor protein) n=1 Tax=Desulfosporosinus metallidurans TaxID=1888891 RepID=A0A1Q8QZL5_9FIRM|nr:HAMP domain-containing methyl-accepting chemotaxis protein [Desulfosporosinus metallidurans]OLN32630.1 Methyl-accepting chemotaxis protein I (serine chemoreceptor protein) [Desulfosporosinus metallidurans]